MNMKLKLLLIGLMVMLLPPVWGGGLQGVGNGQGYDPNAARNDASSILAATWRSAMSVYSKDESWYVGNPVYSATGEDSVTLPLNAAATSIAFDAETSGYIRAEIVGTNSTDTACIHVTLTAAFEDFGDTLAFVGSPASLTDQLNAATWSASLSASGDDLSVIATGTVGTLWQVKKLEIGGL